MMMFRMGVGGTVGSAGPLRKFSVLANSGTRICRSLSMYVVHSKRETKAMASLGNCSNIVLMGGYL